MSYYTLKKSLPNNKLAIGSIFSDTLKFQVCVSERFGWKQVRGISVEDVLKYKKYLSLLAPSTDKGETNQNPNE